MNLAAVEQIARCVLYEGYVLYPYRASAMKNRQRFNFGVLYPPSCHAEPFGNAMAGDGASRMRTECLSVADGEQATLEVRARFLHLRWREIARLVQPSAMAASSAVRGETPEYELVESIEIDGRNFATWQEAEEREFVVKDLSIQELIQQPIRREFSLPAETRRENLSDSEGEVVAFAIRTQQAIRGAIEITTWQLGQDTFKLRVDVMNETAPDRAFTIASSQDRDTALMQSMASAHTVLGVRGGEFVSLLETPDEFREFVASCQNVGTWPVLVGEAGERDLLLSSPIILYDYPQVAPESPGDLFDATENDELLTLCIMSLTDAEKNEVRGLDDRARQLLERTETLPPEQMAKLHGAIRGLKRVQETR